MFEKILLATDGSENSLRAAEKAIGLAKIVNGAKVDVIYVVDGTTSKQDVLRNWDVLGIKDQREQKLNNTERLAKEANVHYEVKFLRGEPAPTIIEYAKEQNMDLIIIGSRGLNSLQEMVLGSVSHKVTKRAHCPVMIIK